MPLQSTISITTADTDNTGNYIQKASMAKKIHFFSDGTATENIGHNTPKAPLVKKYILYIR